jgi:S-adenosylmethionine decarboxylase
MAERSVLYSADLIGCDALSAFAPDRMAASFVSAIERAGGTIVERVSHHFPGTGLTCVLILQESHAILHSWPEFGTINVDVFSCSPRLRGLDAISELACVFSAQHVSIQQHLRAGGGCTDAETADG